MYNLLYLITKCKLNVKRSVSIKNWNIMQKALETDTNRYCSQKHLCIL